MKHVNTELIHLYWEIGGEIERKQHEQGWGKSVVEVLAKELQKEFPSVQGFSARNLWLMRSFYLEYSSSDFAHLFASESSASILHPMGVEIQNSILLPMGAEFDIATLPPLLSKIG